MKSAKLSLETAQEMFDSGIESLRQLAVSTYPELNTYQSIISWAQVLKKLGLKEEPTHPAERLELIYECIRGTKQAVFDGHTPYYCIWWDMKNDRFGNSNYDDSDSCVSSRLFVQNVERINHIMKYFSTDVKQYFIRG